MKKVIIISLTVSLASLFSASSQVRFSPSNYQDDMLAFVRSFLPENPVILEAGGHFGEDTIRMKSVWQNATMHAFEPLPSSFEKMLKNTRDLSQVYCYPYALTSYSGETNFYIDIPNNAASSIGYPVEWNETEFEKEPIQVSCITINEWAKLNSVSRIDFMWLDMEGHELFALQHATDILHAVQAIYTEISFVPIREGSCSYTDLRAFLESQGFYEVWKSCDSGRFGDALFIKKTP